MNQDNQLLDDHYLYIYIYIFSIYKMNDAIIMTPITQGAENTLWPPLTC